MGRRLRLLFHGACARPDAIDGGAGARRYGLPLVAPSAHRAARDSQIKTLRAKGAEYQREVAKEEAVDQKKAEKAAAKKGD